MSAKPITTSSTKKARSSYQKSMNNWSSLAVASPSTCGLCKRLRLPPHSTDDMVVQGCHQDLHQQATSQIVSTILPHRLLLVSLLDLQDLLGEPLLLDLQTTSVDHLVDLEDPRLSLT